MISYSSVQPTPYAATSSTNRTTALLPHRHFHHLFYSTPHSHRRLSNRLQIRAIDAAQPYDYEAHLNNRFAQSNKLKIAIIGFGNFGQFLAKAFVKQGHTVYAHSRSDYSEIAQSIGATFFSDPNDLCERHPDVILLSTSIISTESVLRALPVQRLRRNTLFVDVLSVKEFAKNVFLQVLPSHFDILCTHPMFGPESGKNGWQNLPFVFEKVRIGDEDSRVARVENFLGIFEKEGCRMVEMTCGEHDRYAAGSQFITHTVGRILEKLELKSTPINTKGYETLLDLVENTSGDSFDLYYGLFMYNPNAMKLLEKLALAFEALKNELFGLLHEVLRKQLFGRSEEGGGVRRPTLAKLPKNETPLLAQGTSQLDTPIDNNNKS